MNKASKSLIALTLLVTVLMAATGCGNHVRCSAYGGKQPLTNQAETLH